MTPDTIALDFDGTLCDTDQIAHLQGDWPAFHDASFNCPPRHSLMMFIKRLQTVANVVIVTGKPIEYESRVIKWCCDYGFYPDAILMRPKDDWRKTADLKLQMLREYLDCDDLSKVLVAIEDRDKMVDAYRAAGVTCLQAAPCIENRKA